MLMVVLKSEFRRQLARHRLAMQNMLCVKEFQKYSPISKIVALKIIALKRSRSRRVPLICTQFDRFFNCYLLFLWQKKHCRVGFRPAHAYLCKARFEKQRRFARHILRCKAIVMLVCRQMLLLALLLKLGTAGAVLIHLRRREFVAQQKEPALLMLRHTR